MVVAMGNGLRRGDFFAEPFVAGFFAGLAEDWAERFTADLAAGLASDFITGFATGMPPGCTRLGLAGRIGAEDVLAEAGLAITGFAANVRICLFADFAPLTALSALAALVAFAPGAVTALRFPLMTPSPFCSALPEPSLQSE